jgi:glycosyltransferase involved in cell wall biosynthesis
MVASQDSKAPDGVELIETVKPWDSLNPAQQKLYAEKDGVQREFKEMKWFARLSNGWRAQEEEAFGSYKDRVKDFDVVGDHSWSKWSYTTDKQEIVGHCHSIKSYNSLPRKQSTLTGVSRGHSRFLSSQYHTPVQAIWNPVNLDEYEVISSKVDRVLSLNRIMPQKGIHVFVDAMNQIGVKADVAGDDSKLVPDQNYVQKIKQMCAKSNTVVYHGLVDDKTRKRLLGDAKVLVCLTDIGYQEVFGLSAVEAMASGTPVVAADTWGFVDMIENGKNGFIIKDGKTLQDTVKGIMAGTVKFDAQEVRKSVERFSRKASSERYAKVLQAVARGCRW